MATESLTARLAPVLKLIEDGVSFAAHTVDPTTGVMDLTAVGEDFTEFLRSTLGLPIPEGMSIRAMQFVTAPKPAQG